MSRLIALGCLVISLLVHLWNLRPLDDGDIFTHIVVGRWLPAYARLTEMEQNNPVFISWLSYVAFAKIDELLGLTGVKAFNVGLLALSFLMLFFWHARIASRQSGGNPSVLGLIAGSVCAYYVSATNISARPQSFAYLCFCGLLLALEVWSAKRDRWIASALLCFTLLVFWQNCHPSIPVSIPVIGVYILLRGIPRWFIALPVIAMFCTPDGWSLLALSAYNMDVSRNLLKISEWMPPWHSSVREAMEPFWIVALLSGVGCFLTHWRVVRANPVTGALSGVFLLLTLTSSRFGSFWGFVHAPLLGELVCALWPGSLTRVHINRVRAPACAMVACVTTLALRLNPGATLPLDTPVEVFLSLRQKYQYARIFNYREFGGALEYAGYPDWKVFIDGRLYLFNRDTWDTYHSAALADSQTLLDALIDKHDLFVLHTSYHDALIKALRASNRVTLIIDHNLITVFARNQSAQVP